MSFDKAFFKNIRESLNTYSTEYPSGPAAVTIRAFDRDFRVATILNCHDDLLTFGYYSNAKSSVLPEKVQAKTGKTTALPAITISYGSIVWVEFDPTEAEAFAFKP